MGRGRSRAQSAKRACAQLQIHMSNSPRLRAQSQITSRRDSSPPMLVGAGPAPSFPSPSHEGAERRNGASNTGHLCEGARVPCDRHARLPALHCGDFGPDHRTSFTGPGGFPPRYPGSIGAAFHPMLSKPLKAGPSSGPDDDRTSWDGVTSPACRRRTLLRQPSVPRRRPRLSKAWRQYNV
jgi:hypothetical protein